MHQIHLAAPTKGRRFSAPPSLRRNTNRTWRRHRRVSSESTHYCQYSGRAGSYCILLAVFWMRFGTCVSHLAHPFRSAEKLHLTPIEMQDGIRASIPALGLDAPVSANPNDGSRSIGRALVRGFDLWFSDMSDGSYLRFVTQADGARRPDLCAPLRSKPAIAVRPVPKTLFAET
jgi:hypothetical protein